MARDTIWEVVFLMVILKIPIVYLCLVIWWAIRADPKPEDGAAVHMVVAPEPRPARGRSPRSPRRPQRGGPTRRPPLVARGRVRSG